MSKAHYSYKWEEKHCHQCWNRFILKYGRNWAPTWALCTLKEDFLVISDLNLGLNITCSQLWNTYSTIFLKVHTWKNLTVGITKFNKNRLIIYCFIWQIFIEFYFIPGTMWSLSDIWGDKMDMVSVLMEL